MGDGGCSAAGMWAFGVKGGVDCLGRGVGEFGGCFEGGGGGDGRVAIVGGKRLVWDCGTWVGEGKMEGKGRVVPHCGVVEGLEQRFDHAVELVGSDFFVCGIVF